MGSPEWGVFHILRSVLVLRCQRWWQTKVARACLSCIRIARKSFPVKIPSCLATCFRGWTVVHRSWCLVSSSKHSGEDSGSVFAGDYEQGEGAVVLDKWIAQRAIAARCTEGVEYCRQLNERLESQMEVIECLKAEMDLLKKRNKDLTASFRLKLDGVVE